MILADVGGVIGGDAVFQHPDPGGVEATDHRPSCADTKAGVGEAGDVFQRLADAFLQLLLEFLAVEDFRGLSHLQRRCLQRRRGDGQVLEFVVVAFTGRVVVVVLCDRHGGSKQGTENGGRQHAAHPEVILHDYHSRRLPAAGSAAGPVHPIRCRGQPAAEI